MPRIATGPLGTAAGSDANTTFIDDLIQRGRSQGRLTLSELRIAFENAGLRPSEARSILRELSEAGVRLEDEEREYRDRRLRKASDPKLSSLLVPDLQDIARSLGIQAVGRMRKAQLIDAITARQKADTPKLSDTEHQLGVTRPKKERGKLLYDTIANHIREKIEAGSLPIGARLPTEHGLSEYYGASRNTIRDAIKRLNALGLVVTRPGQGTFVVEVLPGSPDVTSTQAQDPDPRTTASSRASVSRQKATSDVGEGSAEASERGRRASADRAEASSRRALAKHAFDEAVGLLQMATELDPDRAGRLEPTLRCVSEQPGDSPGQLAWRRGVWLVLAADSPFTMRPASPVAVAKQTPRQPAQPASGVADTRVQKSPGEAGQALEMAFMSLLRRFFQIASEDEKAILERLRRQDAGIQFGHDLQFDCTTAADTAVRCHVECKNYGEPLKTKDVADKIFQTQLYWDDKKIDYFVIVTPRVSVGNELDVLIQKWNSKESSPFEIQVWSPDEGIEELLALEPLAYRAVYGNDPPKVNSSEIVARWASRLTPVRRLPLPLASYLTDPRAHCLPGEESIHFEDLFHEPIEVQAASLAGVLKGNLSELLDSWVEDPGQRTLLLLGEFGDGKSFACYCMTRRLAEQFSTNGAGHFALRLPLRDLRAAGSPQELLAKKLRMLGADLKDWNRLQDSASTVIILDGFDEMSAQLDHATVAGNLRLLAECVRYFGGSKILVTSRTHFFETHREQIRFLEQLEHPEVIKLAPLSRNKRGTHLEMYAKNQGLTSKFKQIRRLYDPIGLAAKPLFLQMIKETLADLPDDHFDEIVLYETYVRKSLERKVELIEDENMHTLRAETMEGMIELLEAVAVEQLATGGLPIDLRTFGVGSIDIARKLWKMSQADAGAKQNQDARARLGTRSLLEPVQKTGEAESWPVTFFHRSMSEYFLARAIAGALLGNESAARKLLSSVILGPETVDFVSLLMNKDPATADSIGPILESLARSSVRNRKSGYLGGNAITLTFRVRSGRWCPPRRGWTGLNLDYADLSSADLSKMEFSNSSLRYATLDNADLSDADLTDCDLTGVQFEETAPVIWVSAGRTEDSVLACYGDGSIREWTLSGSRPASERIMDGIASLKSAAWGPHGDLVVMEGHNLALWQITDGTPERLVEFRIRSDIDYIRFGHDTIAFAYAYKKKWIATLAECNSASILTMIEIPDRGPVAFAGDQIIVCPIGNNSFGLGKLGGRRLKMHELPGTGITAIDVMRGEGHSVYIALADDNGLMTCIRSTSNDDFPAFETVASQQLHDGPVLSAAFLSPSAVVSGGVDRNLTVCDLDQGDLRIAHQLRLTLRCARLRVDGVEGERERQRLMSLRDRT